jgi:hypothetical protein
MCANKVIATSLPGVFIFAPDTELFTTIVFSIKLSLQFHFPQQQNLLGLPHRKLSRRMYVRGEFFLNITINKS